MLASEFPAAVAGTHPSITVDEQHCAHLAQAAGWHPTASGGWARLATAYEAPVGGKAYVTAPSALNACLTDHLIELVAEVEPTVEALAQAMRDQYPECTEASLQAEGFSLAFQRQHGDAARTMANKRFVRKVSTPGDRAGRVERAANLAAGLVAHDAIASYLLANGFRPRELGDIMPDVITRMCQLVVGRANEPAQVQ